MFASQLLKILQVQTLPADKTNKICVFDTDEQKPTMKGNQNWIPSRSNGYNEEDSLVFPTKETPNSNGHDNSQGHLACDTGDGNDIWKVPVFDGSLVLGDISRNNNSGVKASSVSDDENVDMPKIISDKRSSNPFECDFPMTNEIDAASVIDDPNGGLSNIIPLKRTGNPFECDTKDRDQPWNLPEFECTMIVDFLDDRENGGIVTDSPFTTQSEFYTDKGVTDHELPELAVCYRENKFNTVKDISMDEGVPAVDKVLIESWKDDQPRTSGSHAAYEDQQLNTRESIDKGSSVTASVSKDSSVDSARNVSETHDTEQEAAGAYIPDGIQSLPEDNSNKDAEKDSYLENLMMIFGSKCTVDGKATNAPDKALSANNAVLSEESYAKHSQRANSDGDQPDQIPFEQATLTNQSAVSASSETNSRVPESTKNMDLNAENLPDDSQTSKVIPVHKQRNSDDLSAANQVHFASSVDNVHQQSVESQNDDQKPSGYLSLGGGQGHFADGEASFSAAGPTSGSVTFSGPISYSGSISLRSDSSTTSARSFAFPVLQSEWNSSPVRMAKAERRHLRKHKGWRQGLLCCRF